MADADEMRDLLTYAAYNKVAAALNVSRNTVSLWARGVNVSPYRLRQVRDLLRPETARNATAPSWAVAMEQRLLEKLEINRQLIGALGRPELLEAAERVIARLEALGPPDDEAPHEAGGSVGRAAAVPPGPGRG